MFGTVSGLCTVLVLLMHFTPCHFRGVLHHIKNHPPKQFAIFTEYTVKTQVLG